MSTLRSFFTASRATAFLGWLVMVWGILETSGVFTDLQMPWSALVSIVGGTLAWLGRSGLAAKKVASAEEPQP